MHTDKDKGRDKDKKNKDKEIKKKAKATKITQKTLLNLPNPSKPDTTNFATEINVDLEKKEKEEDN